MFVRKQPLHWLLVGSTTCCIAISVALAILQWQLPSVFIVVLLSICLAITIVAVIVVALEAEMVIGVVVILLAASSPLGCWQLLLLLFLMS